IDEPRIGTPMLKRALLSTLTALAVATPVTVLAAGSAHAMECDIIVVCDQFGDDSGGEYQTPRIPPAQMDPLPGPSGRDRFAVSHVDFDMQSWLANNNSGTAHVVNYNGYDPVIGTTTPTEAIYSAAPGSYQQGGATVTFTVPTAYGVVSQEFR